MIDDLISNEKVQFLRVIMLYIMIDVALGSVIVQY